MKLIFSIFASAFAQSFSSYSNFDWYESQIHFHYNGGMKNMVVDLFKDFEWPETFQNYLMEMTDESIMGAISLWDSNTQSEFESRFELSNNALDFYDGMLNGMRPGGVEIERADLQAAVYDNFLQAEVADVDTEALMLSIVADHFQPAVDAAVAYYDSTDETTYLKYKTLIPLLSNVKQAIKAYNAGVGIKMPSAAVWNNNLMHVGPIVMNSIMIWENEMDKHEVGGWIYWAVVNFMDDVVWAPLISMCQQDIGPFETMRQMAVKTHYILGKVQYLLDFDTETNNLISNIFFGEEGHMGFNVEAFMDRYLFQYTNELAPLGGMIENELHIWSLMFDSLIEDMVYGLVKGPICGVQDDTVPV